MFQNIEWNNLSASMTWVCAVIIEHKYSESKASINVDQFLERVHSPVLDFLWAQAFEPMPWYVWKVVQFGSLCCCIFALKFVAKALLWLL